MPRERRAAAGLDHERHDLQLPADDRLRVADDDHQAGGILFTGTPHGVIFGKPKAEQVWLKPGDRVACSVERLGELAFTLT
jgi:hypothetical protein